MWYILICLHAVRIKECWVQCCKGSLDWFEPQLHRNIEAYMDDIVVKTKDKATLIQDLEETFANLRKINLKLNPEKCVFGVPSGNLLGFFVSHRCIEANTDKIKAIEQIQAPRTVRM